MEDYKNPADEYEHLVVGREIETNQNIMRLCLRLQEEKNLDDCPWYFDSSVWQKIEAIVEEMTHPTGDLTGQKIKLSLWQKWFLSTLFGWKRKTDDHRRWKTCFLLTGKGNGKTVLTTVVVLLDLLFNTGGQALLTANRKEQSKIGYDYLRQYLKTSELFREYLDFTARAIYNKSRSNSCRLVSGSSKAINGMSLSVGVIDEIAELKNFELYNNVLSCTKKRAESLLFMTTTAQPTTESVGYEEYNKARKIVEGVIEQPRYLPVLYDLDQDDRWDDKKTWIKANPNLDISIRTEDLEELLASANAGIGTSEVTLRTHHLNQWVFGGAGDSWISADRWQRCLVLDQQYREQTTEEKLKDCICTAGLDLSLRNDLSVYTMAFWIPEIGKTKLVHRIYVPEEELENKMKTDSYLFWNWINEGWVRLCEGPIIRNDQIVKDIIEDHKQYNFRELAFDKQFLDHESRETLEKNHISLTMFPQTTMSMSQPTSDFYNAVLLESILDQNPVMRWCISNVSVYRSTAGIKVNKETKGSHKRVDPVITAIMATGRLRYQVQLDEKRKKMNVNSWGSIKY